MQIMIPFFLGLQNLLCDFKKEQTMLWEMEDQCMKNSKTGDAYLYFSAGVVVFVSYSFMLGKMCNHSYDTADIVVGDEDQHIIQRNLTLSGSILSALLIVLCITMIACPRSRGLWCSVMRRLVTVLFSMVNPYLFLITSSEIRAKFIIKCGSSTTTVTQVRAI